MSKTKTAAYETEAVILELEKEQKRAKCKLKPVAGTTFVEIDGTKYLVARQSPVTSPPVAIDAKLWPLDPAGLTQPFDLGESPNQAKSLEQGESLQHWALAAWQAQRKVRVSIDVANVITKITLL